MNRSYKSVFPNGTPSAYIPPSSTSTETSVNIVDTSASTFGPNSVTFFTLTTGDGLTGVYSGGPTGYTKEGAKVVLKNASSSPTFVTNVVNNTINAEVFDHPNSVASASGSAKSISYTGYNAVTWIFDNSTSRYVIIDRF